MIRSYTAFCAVLGCMAAACAGRGAGSSAHPGEGDGGDANELADTRRDAAAAGTPSGAEAPYALAPVDSEGHVAGAGRIAVKVEWREPPAELLRSPGSNGCGEPIAPAVSVHTLHGVRDTVVSLRNVARGRAPNPPGTVELAVRDCRLRPLVSVAPRIGAELAVINDDERPHVVDLDLLGSGEPIPIARIRMPLVGQRFAVVLDRPGIVRAKIAGRSAPAYVHVPAHPYVGLTNDKGAVEFSEVEPGTYAVVAWHRPLTDGGEPLTASAEVKVAAAEESSVTIALSK